MAEAIPHDGRGDLRRDRAWRAPIGNQGKAVDPGFAPKERDVIIERGKSVTFPCDPTMELVPPTFNYDVLRNLSAELHLTVKYSVHAIF